MNLVVKAVAVLAYLTAVALVLLFHAYALHLDETSETEPAPAARRQA